MNILVLTRHKKGRIAERLHIAFLLGLREFGYTIEVVYQFNKLRSSAKELVDQYEPDMLLCYTSYEIESRQIKNLDCCKAIIETDFYKKVERNQLGWYKDCNFDLIIQRGSYGLTLDVGVPMVWLPFSADPEEFYPDLYIERESVVGFAGSYGAASYPQRRNAMEELKKAGIYKEYKKSGPEYADNLRRSLMWLTSTEKGTPHGKVFEAMATGTIVLTPSFLGEKNLFGEKECFVRYEDDCSNIVEQARRIINDPEYAKIVRDNALDTFWQFHTHKRRLEELDRYLLNVYHGCPVSTFWFPEQS